MWMTIPRSVNNESTAFVFFRIIDLRPIAVSSRHTLQHTQYGIRRYIYIIIAGPGIQTPPLFFHLNTASLLLIFLPMMAKSFPRMEYFFISSL